MRQSISMTFPCLFVLASLATAPACLSDVPNDDTFVAEDETSADEAPEEETETFVPSEEGDGPMSTCDPFEQDCLDGEKCVPYASTGGNWDANKCVPVLGDGAPGDECTWDGAVEATDSCDASSHCWEVAEVDGTLVGTCTSFCEGSPDDPQCDQGTSCLIANTSINLCVPSCDPLLQDCQEGQGCYWAANGDQQFQCIFHSGSEIATGEACGFINDCQPSNLCADASLLPACEGSSCCASYCELGNADCGEGTECVPFFEDNTAPPEYVDVGVCIIPGA